MTVRATPLPVADAPHRPLDNRVLRDLGRISYGIYLYHLPAYWALSAALERLHLPMPSDEPTKFVLGSALAIVVAALSWHAFEQPINRLKRRLPFATVVAPER